VERAWRRYPNARLGVPCASKGIVGLDADQHPGKVRADLDALERVGGMRRTCVHSTGYGTHTFFLDPEVPLRANPTLLPGWEVKFNHFCCSHLRCTSTASGTRGIDDSPVAEMPDLLIDVFKAPVTERPAHVPLNRRPTRREQKCVDKAVGDEIKLLPEGRPGERNITLTRVSFIVGQWADYLTRSESVADRTGPGRHRHHRRAARGRRREHRPDPQRTNRRPALWRRAARRLERQTTAASAQPWRRPSSQQCPLVNREHPSV